MLRLCKNGFQQHKERKWTEVADAGCAGWRNRRGYIQPHQSSETYIIIKETLQPVLIDRGQQQVACALLC